MKTLILTLFSILTLTQLQAQKIEVSVQANSGLFHYSGNSATSATYINGASDPKNDYTNNPLGNKNAFSYGAAIQAQYISKGGFIWGMQAGYEVLRSKVDITGFSPDQALRFLVSNSYYSYDPVSTFTASGHTILTDQFINVSPYIGYRINAKKINIDLMPGLDLGFCVNSHEDGEAVATDGTNNVYKTDLKRTSPSADLRLKFGAAATYKKWGIVASFAHGLSNYTSQPLNDSSVDYKAKSELITLGISYRIL